MRRILIALASLTLLTAPALADQVADAKAAIASAGLSKPVDKYLWCGAAFTIMAVVMDDPTQQKNARDAATVLFRMASPLLVAEGVAEADFSKLSGNYAIVVNSQLTTQGQTPDYTQEDCSAALGA
ncbi:MAG: hypothetical protein ABIQ30_02255 [Devosia sp.]